MMQNESNYPCGLVHNGNLVGFAWLNNLAGNTAYAHFAFAREGWGHHADELGHEVIKYWLSWPGEDGPLIEFIIGIIPGFNRFAQKFVERLGFTRSGSVPGMIRTPHRDEDRTSAEIYYLSRFDYGKGRRPGSDAGS